MASNEPHILVINSGSSSLKFTVFDPVSEEVLGSGIAERLGTDGAGLNLGQTSLKLVDLAQKRHDEELAKADHRSALLRIIEVLTKSGRFGVKAIGHRVVHGGEYFQEAVIRHRGRGRKNRRACEARSPPQSAECTGHSNCRRDFSR